MTSGLEAILPRHKYYVLCVISRLKNVGYNATYSAVMALHMIISALTESCRLSWLYAIHPSIEGNEMEIRSIRWPPSSSLDWTVANW
jgi:hypothetical protein